MAQRPTLLTFPDKPKNLKIGAELNRGAWGAVYNGQLEGRPVAVKKIHELLHQGGGKEEGRKLFEDFREECKKLQSLNHPHIVGFIGAFNDPRLGPILVMEKMQENLRQFLDKCKKNLRHLKQIRISLEIIRGVDFLHQQTPPLVHRDLNDKNVMFSTEGVIKIGDFGQCKLKKDLYLTSRQPGMVTFMPPEALDADTSKYNESLDIFSVGVLMLEIGTQQEPLVNLRGIGTIPEVERRERDLKALGEEHPLRLQILLCLKDDPNKRPKASDLQREVLALVDGGVEATTNELKSQITTLQAALDEAGVEIAAMKEHEAKQTSQFQATTSKLKSQITILEAGLRGTREKRAAMKEHEAKLTSQFQATTNELKSQITTLQAALEEAREEIAAMKEHEAKQTSQFQTNTSKLRSQITILEAGLRGARVEIAARKEHEAKLTSQLQSEVASCDANIRQLEERCELLEAQSTIANIRQLEERCEELEAQEVPLPPSLRKEVRNIKLPNMPIGAVSYGASIHNSKVYISALYIDGNGKTVSPVLVYSTSELKWNTLPEQQNGGAVAVVNNHVTLIGGRDVSTRNVINTLSTWYEEEGRWKQVLPPMPRGKSAGYFSPASISHDNLLLVTGGLADGSTVLNTTEVLDLTTMKWSTPEGLNLPVPLYWHHMALCGVYLYLMGGAMVFPHQLPENDNPQAWRAKWSDVKQTAAPQHSQPQRGVWTQIADPPTLSPTPVSCGGTLYTFGGRTRDCKPISTVYSYIAARNQWVSVGDMSVGRVNHCAVPLSSNSIFVAGGRVVNEGKWTYSLLTELLVL